MVGNTTISLDSISGNLKEKFSSWKTGVMNQYLLNEDVYVYDFANAEPMICTIMGEVPCCRADGDFWKDPVPEELKKWKSAWYRNSGVKRGAINCPVSFGIEYEGKNNCWIGTYPELKCEGIIYSLIGSPYFHGIGGPTLDCVIWILFDTH